LIACPAFDPLLYSKIVCAFTIASVKTGSKGNEITKKVTLVPPPHERGVSPAWLHDLGASVIIAGGMGGRAIDLFKQNSINVIVGAPAQEPDELVQSYLNNKLVAGINVCDH